MALVGKKIALHGRLGAGREGAGMCSLEQIENHRTVGTLVWIDDWPREWDASITPRVDDGKFLDVIACGVLRKQFMMGFVFALTPDPSCSRALEPITSPRER